jgi:hypothetical protein
MPDSWRRALWRNFSRSFAVEKIVVGMPKQRIPAGIRT